MNYFSVCSGIEAASVAWHSLGFTPVGFSEIEPFPCAVLEHHYPHVKNYGDMTKFMEWTINEPIDIVVGGTPCQSFSVAGLRKGLKDPRGNLMLSFLGMVDRFKPKWFLWENVPGVLSSGARQDFARFLLAANEIGYSCSWRILDAQYFGVPQRRRRIYVVGYFGDWRHSAQVLLEPESLLRDSKAGEKEKKGTAYHAEKGTGRILQKRSFALTTKSQRNEPEAESYIAFQSNASSHHSMPVLDNLTPTLTTNAKAMAVCFSDHHRDGIRFYGSQSPTLTTHFGTGGGNVPCVTENETTCIAPNIIGRSDNAGGNQLGINTTGISYTLDTAQPQAVQYRSHVRRITPLECERLQGFPDNYTLIKTNKSAKLEQDMEIYLTLKRPDLSTEEIRRLAKDTPRYKALGNSMAVPVMKWIGEGILGIEKGGSL